MSNYWVHFVARIVWSEATVKKYEEAISQARAQCTSPSVAEAMVELLHKARINEGHHEDGVGIGLERAITSPTDVGPAFVPSIVEYVHGIKKPPPDSKIYIHVLNYTKMEEPVLIAVRH